MASYRLKLAYGITISGSTTNPETMELLSDFRDLLSWDSAMVSYNARNRLFVYLRSSLVTSQQDIEAADATEYPDVLQVRKDVDYPMTTAEAIALSTIDPQAVPKWLEYRYTTNSRGEKI